MANLSCGLLEFRLSREVVELASKVLDTVTDLFASQVAIRQAELSQPILLYTSSIGRQSFYQYQD